LDDKQIERIIGQASHRWAKDAYTEVLEKIKELELAIKEHKAILKDPERRKSIYREELEQLKKAKF
jgi:DNA gyrase/topoisomerase IV subunit A